MVLVLVTGSEISPENVEKITPVLLPERFVHVIFCLNVPFDDLRKGSFSVKRSTGGDSDDEEAESDDDQHGRDHAYQSFDDVFCHRPSEKKVYS